MAIRRMFLTPGIAACRRPWTCRATLHDACTACGRLPQSFRVASGRACAILGFILQPSPMPYKIPESVLVVIYTPDLQVLLLERADRPGFWQSVTGSLDAIDEPLALTAVR